MSAYFIASIRIHDRALYQQYLNGTDSVLKCFQGEVLAVDDHPYTIEGSWGNERIVVIRFPDKKTLLAWYRSPEYQEIAKYRHHSADTTGVAIEGLHN